VEVAEGILGQRVDQLWDQDDIDPALIVKTAAGDLRLVELRFLDGCEIEYATRVAIPEVLQEVEASAVALITDAWEPNMNSPGLRREVATVWSLDCQGIGVVRSAEIIRSPLGPVRMGELETAPASRVPESYLAAMIDGLGVPETGGALS